jgi:hypothetical protein
VRIGVDAFHRRQIDHQPIVDNCAPRPIVAAAMDCHLKIQRSREVDGVDPQFDEPAATLGSLQFNCNEPISELSAWWRW